MCRVDSARQLQREELPQIDQKDIPEFLNHLKKNKVKVIHDEANVSSLIPSQNKLNWEKVEHLMTKKEKKLKEKPIFISKNKEILDGHHRWYALKMINKNASIPTYVIELNFNDAVNEMKSFHKTYSKTLEHF